MEASYDIENISSTARRKRKRIKRKNEKLPKHDTVVRGELDGGSSSDSPDERQEAFKDREKLESGKGDSEIDNEYEDQIQVTPDEVLIKTEENINDVGNEISSGKEKDNKASENLDTDNKPEAFGNPQNKLLIVQINDGMFYSDFMFHIRQYIYIYIYIYYVYIYIHTYIYPYIDIYVHNICYIII